jgi:ribonuclease Z
MKVQVLGSGAGGPFQGRHFTAHVVEVENHRYLIDCGEGTQMQLYRYRIGIDRCDEFFITHLHGDHVFGLVGLLTSFSLKQRTRPLTLYAPPGLHALITDTFKACGVLTPYEIHIVEVDASKHQLVFENKLIEVWSIPLNHRTACCGWLFREKRRPRNMIKEKIEEYEIPYTQMPAIKAGADFILPDGTCIPNAEITTDPPAPRSFAFCSDTAYSDEVVSCVNGVDLLYHEATFTNEHQREAEIAFHTTAAQAASVASQAGVGKLLMGHFSGRYKDLDQHLKEARSVFPESHCVEEGVVYEV